MSGEGGRGQKVVRSNETILNECNRLLEHVLELADVAREVVLREGLHDVVVQARAHAHFFRILVQKEAREVGDVFTALP